MNDSIIINTISKIHFIIVSALSFIFLLLFIIFIFLQNGTYIEDISLQDVKIKKLYIKWDEKISLTVKEFHVLKEKRDSKSQNSYKEIIKIVQNILPFTDWFKKITIEKISFNDINATLEYLDNEKGAISISAPDFMLNSSLQKENNLIHVAIDKFVALENNLKIDGDIVVNAKNNPELVAALNIGLCDKTKLNLYVYSDIKQLFYKIESKSAIKDAKQIVDLFDINPRIKYWIYDAIKMSSLSLDTFYGDIEYKNLNKAYLNIHAKATANDLTYIYDEKVDSVRTSKTDLEFKDGVLYIRPKDAYSYDFFLDKSWLKIDFSKQEELLTLYLLFKGQANKNLISLLDRYKIKLPFIQTKGTIDSNLKLEINLISTDVEAIGDFYTQDAQIKYLGLDIDIFDAHIFINNSVVKVENMVAKYGDIATSHVDLDFNGKESSGKLTFRFDEIELSQSTLKLLNNKKPLGAAYIISPKQDYLKIDKSIWQFKEKILHVDSMELPFDMKNFSTKIPKTAINSPELASIFMSGDIYFDLKKANLNIDLLKLSYLGIKLDKPLHSLNLIYDKEILTLSSKDKLDIDINNKKLNFENIALNITPSLIKVENLLFNFEESIKSRVTAEYSLENSTGILDISDINFTNNTFGEIFKNDEGIKLFIENKNEKFSVVSKEHELEYLLDNNDWIFKINSIEKIEKYSKILQEYNLTNGYFTMSKKNTQNDIDFLLNTDYKYKFLASDNKPINNYVINGKYDSQTKDINISVNNIVKIEVKDDIKIAADNIGININEIIDFFGDKNSTQETKKDINVYIDTKNCYIYLSENRQIISDTINFKYLDKVLSAELVYKNAKAVFNLNDNKLYLYGKNFNDEFMEKLFALSKFKGGSLEFYIIGALKEYNGMFYVKDTTILEYKILNNILAFVNTVPSLVTFSLPGYNKNGVAAKSAYMAFNYKDDVYNMNNIYLKSKEIEIVGIGEASIEKNSINLDLNLKTALGSSISKIPLVGHILLGKENLSTTLKVTGTLDNPDVNTQIAKDIAVAPFNIIKRTLMFPFELFKSEDTDDE
ncbi:MAG: hypothetical protein A2513_04280 [Sulfurimonas sp. RIFOXYD12_FULL_33_39]|uniref:YhdP family protein n=1 Tax=unclassified Sulfurimonas TaxID=2623549 RepID=UPI0008D2E4A6|nr:MULTISPECIES: AsmA-like C-terminal domain-containing protein [unclassified Sulfurimonas]OHE04140.1 MAG: hypothetical protein A3G74_01535 [Sulfurimonas sp. RIFCSPLOWO2_12_FULL_34_6]OHE09353.1 MAG: hypothetical protein A2513_04280 [Sulfurimonas sp. RIFOXYD12_FULL_33_39]OHE12864.1 MAG: hypothetical protein A2530_04525 [Sulfurimonas sp. RIFOXYD2_FULL_34_21]